MRRREKCYPVTPKVPLEGYPQGYMLRVTPLPLLLELVYGFYI